MTKSTLIAMSPSSKTARATNKKPKHLKISKIKSAATTDSSASDVRSQSSTMSGSPVKKGKRASQVKKAPSPKARKENATKSVVFCGDIFNTKDLMGNILLQEAIQR